ncbi:MAG: hypothetical protein E6R03_01155 [Hyphomicrobiaceae bacterium]|nr:MAG: hypothetical protein E6R03_01155 [Hyphomicrobiaceae bacterium]
MKKPAIPSIPKLADDRHRFDGAIKERLEIVAGERGGKLAKLPADADLPTTVAKINELIELLQ